MYVFERIRQRWNYMAPWERALAVVGLPIMAPLALVALCVVGAVGALFFAHHLLLGED